jgi:hypothetical protein
VSAGAQAVELDRVVPPSGNLWLAGQQIWLGPALTGRTVRLWAGLDRVHVLLDGYRVKTLPSRLDARPGPPRRGRCPPRRAAAAAPGMRGARAGTAQPPRLPEPLVVTRRVSARGAIMIGGQKIQVGLAHARKTAEVSVEADTYQVTVEPGITITAPRATSRDIRRHKASNYA